MILRKEEVKVLVCGNSSRVYAAYSMCAGRVAVELYGKSHECSMRTEKS